jgi:hypothetical protein
VSDQVLLRVSVECVAGYRSDETPLRFRLRERVVEIIEELDRWLAPDHRYFKVRTADGIYILRNDVTSGEWEVTLRSYLINGCLNELAVGAPLDRSTLTTRH